LLCLAYPESPHFPVLFASIPVRWQRHCNGAAQADGKQLENDLLATVAPFKASPPMPMNG
jgi:hypothetical protein